MYRYCLHVRDSVLRAVGEQQSLSLEVINCGESRTFTQRFTCLLLQVVHKGAVTFVGNDGQPINVMYAVAQRFVVHAVAVLINAQAQATSHFLSLEKSVISDFPKGV